MIGKTIGQYQVIDKIGEGGMGAAYISPDGKYLFFSQDSDIYWINAGFIKDLK